jgi:hypothetical protein
MPINYINILILISMHTVSIVYLTLILVLLFINDEFYFRSVINIKTSQKELLELPNGDEYLYGTYHLGNMLKLLPRDANGMVSSATYNEYLTKIKSKDYSQLASLPLASGSKLKFVDPLAPTLFEMTGPPFDGLSAPAPFPLNSDDFLAQIVEVYAMALARDIPFDEYENNRTINKLCESLSKLSKYMGPTVNGRVVPKTIFRGYPLNNLVGPYVSQFLYKPIKEGCMIIPQKFNMQLPGKDFMTTMSEYLSVQNGQVQQTIQLTNQPSYIRTGRDLSTYFRADPPGQCMRNTALILFANYSAALNPTIYTNTSMNPFLGVGGMPYVLYLIEKAAYIALNHAFYHKWYVHRSLRPEEAGFIINQFGKKILSPALDLDGYVFKKVHDKNGNYLLPQAYPDGSPVHPADNSGHAAATSAGITILKAFFNNDFVIPDPVIPDATGQNLIPYVSSSKLTIGGELDKLASNASLGGRNMAGIHYRMDIENGAILGEKVALKILEEVKDIYAAKNIPIKFELNKRNGEHVIIQ